MNEQTDQQLEIEFDNYFTLFRNDGYKQLVKELSNQLNRLDDVSDVKDLDDLRIRQGQIYMIKQLINLENATEMAYQDWLENKNNE